MSTIGERVRELRQAKGLSQQALSGDGISPGYVSLIESGKRTPSPAAVERLAERLGVPVDRLTDTPQGPASDEVQLAINFARLALSNGDSAEAIRCLGDVPLDRLDSNSACAAALVLATALRDTGQVDRSVAVLESLVDRCRREESWITFANGCASLAVTYMESGDVDRAVEISELSLRQLEEVGLRGTDEHIRLGSVLVAALFERGDLLFATYRIEELIEFVERSGSTRSRGSVYWSAATVAAERGRIGEALKLTDRAVALFSDDENTRELPRLRLNYAWLLLSADTPRPKDALLQLDRAEADPLLAASELDLGTAATFRGRALLLLDEVDEAAEQAAYALQTLGPSEHVERASALLLLGDVGIAQINLDLAMEALGEAELVLSHMKPSRTIARLWRELGDSWRDLGVRDRALDAYDRSFSVIGFAPRPSVTRIPRGAFSAAN